MQTAGEKPVWGAAAVAQPVWFDPERAGSGYHGSFLDPADAVGKFLYVNEPLVSGSEFQVRQGTLSETQQLRLAESPSGTANSHAEAEVCEGADCACGAASESRGADPLES